MNPSSIRIDREGRWFFEGVEITHRRTYLLYSRHLTRDPAGRPVVRIGDEEVAVEVEDAPFVVQSLDFARTENGRLQSITLILNDATREMLDLKSLRIGVGNVPYCRVRGGIFEARFSRGAYQLLASWIQYDEKRGCFFIALDKETFQIGETSKEGNQC